RALIREKEVDLQEDFGGRPLWKTLLEPTRIYVQPLLPLIAEGIIHGMAHITGGGLYENVPRMFPGTAADSAGGNGGNGGNGAESSATAGGGTSGSGTPLLRAHIWKNKIQVPEVFSYLQSLGVDEEEMFRTFNMGTGMVCAVATEDAEKVIASVQAAGIPAGVIGTVEEGGDGLWLE
ncbi:MAG: AIR synthase-related protein, partial [Spirochaetota bacterium]|nr:AIR synthase-related protein [Spirochaetota bacterium]